MAEFNLDNLEQNVMDELKDFQRVTVDRIHYLFTKKGQKRILLSDEVGLGKTLVAKGVMSRFLKYRVCAENDNIVKVVYICSNSTIVDQNLNKLKIDKRFQVCSGNTSRLSMQHLNIFNQEYGVDESDVQIQLIPLTPETSFNVSNSQGTVEERALMYAILKRFPLLGDYLDQLEEIFRYGVNKDNWVKSKCHWEAEVRKCKAQKEYEDYMEEKLLEHPTEIDSLKKYCEKIPKKGFEKKKAKTHIVTFRKIFANISMGRLDPDLIIMDEFQRFRQLLNSDKESEMDMLTKKFFNSDARILMLSATPYKLYSTLDEISQEDIDAHYSEFFEVVNFLKKCETEKEKFKKVWDKYSLTLKEFGDDKNSFIRVKNKAENELYKNMCRTERITENHLADIVNANKIFLQISDEDIGSYIEAQNLLDEIKSNIHVPVDYVKSSPYIMSFMNDYKLKTNIDDHFKKNLKDISKMEKDTFWLNKEKIDNYEKISPNNARLNYLIDLVLSKKTSNLLWMPPSIPYYELGGAFKGHENYSKTLIFSSWEMVPRMISSMVSYEFERQTIGQLKDYGNYYDRIGSYRNRSKVLEKMYLFTLIFPSNFLIKVYDPIDCYNRDLSIDEIEIEIKYKINQKLNDIPSQNDGGEDDRWYYLAPLFLDSQSDVKLWFASIYENSDSFGGEFKNLFDRLEKEYDEYNSKSDELGKMPDDLIDILCDIAISSPAICAYRSYEKELPSNHSMEHYLFAPSQIGRKFISFLNQPESTAIINLNYGGDPKFYLKKAFKYLKDGNLQAVFDEYVHLLSNGLEKDNENRILIINNRFLSAFEFRTTYYDFDTFDSFKSRMETGDRSKPSIRTHFAASFTKGRTDEKDSNRKKSVINAFNSPFRPFVLTSTSIGQEGLDFHSYCRQIVHWNLPSNPIDLEQREGRINRFECLAIRQNVAKRYGIKKFEFQGWKEIFEIASNYEKTGNCSHLIPYWGLTDSKDMIKIERIVPMYPFSSDEIKYDRLIQILSLYRLTLGQPRQEELLESILNNSDIDESNLDDYFINLSPYYKEDTEDFEIDCEDNKVDENPI